MCCGEIVSLSRPSVTLPRHLWTSRIHCLPDKNTYMSHAAFSCFCYALGKVPRDCLAALPTGKRTPVALAEACAPACAVRPRYRLRTDPRVSVLADGAPCCCNAAQWRSVRRAGSATVSWSYSDTAVSCLAASCLVRCGLPVALATSDENGPTCCRAANCSLLPHVRLAIQFACLARVLQACVRLSAYPSSNVCASINCLAGHVK